MSKGRTKESVTAYGIISEKWFKFNLYVFKKSETNIGNPFFLFNFNKKEIRIDKTKNPGGMIVEVSKLYMIEVSLEI